MATRELKDFIGFTFDNKSSDELGIVRVSDGDRFDEQLHPEIKDITAEVPGMDGEYYFGSTYGNKEIDIKIAYDSLTEVQFRELRRIFSGKEIHELIFDERPYKKYLVKLSGPIELNYICFDEMEYVEDTTIVGLSGNHPLKSTGKTHRVYKGEGTINLVVYFPFAKSVYKVLPEDSIAPNNIDEWKESSGILDFDTKNNYKIDQYYQNQINIYNPGDLETGFRLYCPFDIITKEISHIIPPNSEDVFSIPDSRYKKVIITSNSKLGYTYIIDRDLNKIFFTNQNDVGIEVIISYLSYNTDYSRYKELELNYKLNNQIIAQLYLKNDNIKPIGEDEGFIIDTNNGLMVGVKDFQIDASGNPFYSTTGNLYNQYIEGGYLFKLKPTLAPNESYIEIINGNENMKIFYDYLYF